ncbi:hypothetical protein ACQPUL_03095 [Clostridium butyricum]|uniref:hypothetical protein n=1 Tax=Clostridium butyricum TaxID=1492 RepID=UPI003D334731
MNIISWFRSILGKKLELNNSDKKNEVKSQDNSDANVEDLISKVIYSNIKGFDKAIIIDTFLEFDISQEYIKCINITFINNSNGCVKPILHQGKLKFNISLSEKLFKEDDDKQIKLVSTFQHELFHCKEMIMTSLKIGEETLVNCRSKKDIKCWYDWVNYLSWYYFSEYYAYYNNCHLYRVHDEFDLKECIIRCDKVLKYMQSICLSDGKVHVNDILSEPILRFFIATITHLAYYKATNDIRFIQEFEDTKNTYTQIYNYFNWIKEYVPLKYFEYPSWINKSGYFEFGEKIISIFEFYGFKYFSDNPKENIDGKMYVVFKPLYK